MSANRLPTHVEVGAIIRRVTAEGGFATVMKKGDAERGSVLLLVSSRGVHVVSLERILNLDGSYVWQPVGPGESASSAEIRDFLARRTRFDEDCWAIELDIADAERFIAETTSAG